MISSGCASAANTINSAIPLFNVLVASLAPFLIFIKIMYLFQRWSLLKNI